MFDLSFLEPLICMAGIIVIIASGVRGSKSQKKRMDKLDEMEQNNPGMYEKIEVKRSKTASFYRKNLETSRFTIIVMLIPIAITLMVIYIMTHDRGYSEFIIWVPFVVFICAVVVLKFKSKYDTIKLKDKVFEILKNKYGLIEKLKTPAPIILEGKKSKVGNIRSKYFFSCKISRYNCVFSNYYKEKLFNEYDGDSFWVRYRRIANIMQYCYDLKNFGLVNINNDILLEDNIKQAIEKLLEIKEFKVTIKNTCVIVDKETVFEEYHISDAVRDAEDIELFYEKMIKVIIEEVKS